MVRARAGLRPSGCVEAAIDIGSNSIKLRVGRCWRGDVDVLLDTTEVVRLGRGLADGCIPEAAIRDGVRAVSEMVLRAREMGAEPVLVGTMVLRAAGNAEEFLRRVREATGCEVRVLSGEEEARLSWEGAVADFAAGDGDLVLFDTGGGSTEFVFGRGRAILSIQSVPIGAVSLTQRFFGHDPAGAESLMSAEEYVRGLLHSGGVRRWDPGAAPSVVGLGGGVVAMASVKARLRTFLPVRLHGMTLTRRDLEKQARLYASLTLPERRRIVGLPASRADVVLGSACIVLCAMEALDVPSFTLSINGLRHGVLLEAFEEDGCFEHYPRS